MVLLGSSGSLSQSAGGRRYYGGSTTWRRLPTKSVRIEPPRFVAAVRCLTAQPSAGSTPARGFASSIHCSRSGCLLQIHIFFRPGVLTPEGCVVILRHTLLCDWTLHDTSGTDGS
jgi:hypothetical protein